MKHNLFNKDITYFHSLNILFDEYSTLSDVWVYIFKYILVSSANENPNIEL